MTAYHKIAVIGTGIVGLATAMSLNASGADCRVTVFGEQPQPYQRKKRNDMRVFAINHASRAFLDTLGVWKAIVTERAFAYREMTVWSGDGTLRFDADDVNAGAALGYIVENDLIRATLFEHIQSHKDIKLRCPSIVRDIRQVSDGANAMVEVETDAGDNETYDLVIGADGARSATRALAHIDARYTDYNQSAVVATLSVPDAEGGYCRQRFFDDGVLAFLPLGKSEGKSENEELSAVSPSAVSIVWSCRTALAEELCALTPEKFASRVAAAFTDAFKTDAADIKLLSKPVTFPITAVFADNPVAGNVVLVGDAAHTVHPMAGLGVNLGLADAQSLARLAGENKKVDARALSAYASDSTRRARRLQTLLDGLHIMFSPQMPSLLRDVREMGLNCVNRSRFLKAWFAHNASYNTSLWP